MPKSFTQKKHKKLSSQIENLNFRYHTLKIDYAANSNKFPGLFCKIEKWTLFLSIFHFPKKVLEKKIHEFI